MPHNQKVRDAVCGMEIDPAKAAAKSEFQGDTYYFCSTGCKSKFDEDAARYSAESRVQPEIGNPR
jgi:P-type Cu+ transporter